MFARLAVKRDRVERLQEYLRNAVKLGGDKPPSALLKFLSELLEELCFELFLLLVGEVGTLYPFCNTLQLVGCAVGCSAE